MRKLVGFQKAGDFQTTDPEVHMLFARHVVTASCLYALLEGLPNLS